jgi:hypothetical protein
MDDRDTLDRILMAGEKPRDPSDYFKGWATLCYPDPERVAFYNSQPEESQESEEH